MKDKSKKELAQELKMLRRLVDELGTSESDLKQKEALSRKSAEKYRVIADNTCDWEFWLSSDAQFVYSSPSCERIAGYRSEEFEADPTLFYRMIHPEDLSRVTDHINRKKYDPGLAEIEYRIIRRDGAERWIAFTFQPVYDADSRFLGTRGSNRDITERKRAEMERETLIRQLREAYSKLQRLIGLLPFCSSCGTLPDDEQYWNQIECYIRDFSQAFLSHGICPECRKKDRRELSVESANRKAPQELLGNASKHP